jgi:ABC-type bacteriocin/lantibiotic exporter with double-glycine peptidase domain
MSTNNQTIISRLWNLLSPDRIEVRNVYIFAIFSGVLSLGLPLGIQLIINFIQLGQLSASWFLLVGLVIFAIGFSGTLNILQLRITETLQQRVFARSALEFAYRIPKLKLEKLKAHYNPEFNARFFDTLTIQKAISKLLIDFMAASLQIVFGLILLAFYHNFFILFGIVLIILLYAIIRFTSKAGYQTSLIESSGKYAVTNWLNEVNNAKTSFRNSSTELNLIQADIKLHNYLDARKNHFRILVIQYRYLIVFKILIALSLLIVGGILVVNQQMNIGQFVAAEIIIVLLLSSVEKIILNLDLVYDVLTSIEKIGQVTDFPIEQDTGNHDFNPNSNGIHLELKGLTYHADELNSDLLQDCSFINLPGQKTCVVSDSSVSTSTLFLIILGQFEEFQGHVYIDNLPIVNLNKNSVKKSIGTLLSTDRLVYGTVAENIHFGNENISLPDIVGLCSQLNLESFIDGVDNKYNAVINPDFNFIPQDIQTKILIARALISEPKLVLMEEPTAAMSKVQKSPIINQIKHQEKTSFIIATHDDDLHQIADQIVEIQNGKITFIGNYQSFKNQSTC